MRELSTAIFLYGPNTRVMSVMLINLADEGALEAGERPLDWKPEVCWQLPLRLEESTDDHGHVTSTLREWKRRDWGDGGEDFHWWCTEAPEAFIGRRPVWETCEDELVALSNEATYASLRTYLRTRTADGWTPIPHPVLKKKRSKPK